MPAPFAPCPVYVTLKTPVDAADAYHTLVHIGSTKAKGETTPNGVVDKIWSEFADRDVRRVKLQNGKVVSDIQMTYWKTPSTTCQDFQAILSKSDGDGSCIAWSQLLARAISDQGVSGAGIYEITADTTVNPGANGFMVKHWRFGSHITTGKDGINNSPALGDDVLYTPVETSGAIAVLPGANGILDSLAKGDDTVADGVFAGTPYPYVVGADAINQSGIPGQGNPEPPEIFLNHFVVKYGGSIYDPSYGAGPYTSELAHENAAIDGIVNGNRARKNDTSKMELLYTLRASL